MNTYRVKGPDATAIGWIPYYDKWPDIPKPHLYRRSIAMRVLFNSGNSEPRENFSDGDTFQAWVDSSKDYRGALWMRDVTLEWSDEDVRPVLTYTGDGLVGYTPPRVIVRGTDLTPPLIRGYYDGRGAYSASRPKPDPDWGGVEVTLQVKFKLSGLWEKFGYLMTRYWAPSAWMELSYRIEKSGRVALKFCGSSIPSQAYYVNWRRGGGHDMLHNVERQIDSFIEQSESCKIAPGREECFEPPEDLYVVESGRQ